jgi:hypothetical protein
MAGPPTCAGSPHLLHWVMPWQQGITLHLILSLYLDKVFASGLSYKDILDE